MIRHIISWKLVAEDEAGKALAFDALAAAFTPLPSLIPEIVALTIARDLDETAGNWDVVLIVDYATTADLEAYQVHPEHLKVKKIVGPLVSQRAAVDFEV